MGKSYNTVIPNKRAVAVLPSNEAEGLEEHAITRYANTYKNLKGLSLKTLHFHLDSKFIRCHPYFLRTIDGV